MFNRSKNIIVSMVSSLFKLPLKSALAELYRGPLPIAKGFSFYRNILAVDSSRNLRQYIYHLELKAT
jgi:hypothetical protein